MTQEPDLGMAYMTLIGGGEAAVRLGTARAFGDTRGREVSIHASCDRPELERLGFEFLEDPAKLLEGKIRQYQTASETDVHVRVQLPEGWSMGPSEDYRLKYIYDERGVLRVQTQYNGQFWDPYGYTNIVNLGWWIPMHLCYGDDVTLESVWWEKLTDEERASAISGLRRQAAKTGAYSESADRARAWLKQLGADAIRCRECDGQLSLNEMAYNPTTHKSGVWVHEDSLIDEDHAPVPEDA